MMTKTITGYAVYDDGRSPGVIEFKDDLEWFQEFIKCGTIDMPTRFVDNHKFVFVVDDCGRI